MCYVIFRKEHKLKASEDERLKRALGPNRGGVRGNGENCMKDNYMTITMRRVMLLGWRNKIVGDI